MPGGSARAGAQRAGDTAHALARRHRRSGQCEEKAASEAGVLGASILAVEHALSRDVLAAEVETV